MVNFFGINFCKSEMYNYCYSYRWNGDGPSAQSWRGAPSDFRTDKYSVPNEKTEQCQPKGRE